MIIKLMIINKTEILTRVKTIFEGLNQTEVAKICGVTHQAVSRYYRMGILPKYDAMLIIAKYANVTMEWLLAGEEPKEPPPTVREAEALYKVEAAINIITFEEYKKLLQNIRFCKTFFLAV